MLKLANPDLSKATSLNTNIHHSNAVRGSKSIKLKIHVSPELWKKQSTISIDCSLHTVNMVLKRRKLRVRGQKYLYMFHLHAPRG